MRTASTALATTWLAIVLANQAGCMRCNEPPTANRAESTAMTENQKTVERYLDGFRTGDHALVLSCLTEDVEWEIPGMFHVTGKAAFDKEIENEAFVGRPVITTSRLTEQNDVVIAEGAVRAEKKEGGILHVRFCDVFEMREGKIRKLTSYLAEVK